MTSTPKVGSPDHIELWRLEQLALVSQVATQVTKILDLDELLERVVGLIYQTFQFYAVSLCTLEEEMLVLRAQAGPTGSYTVQDAFIPEVTTEIPLGQGIVGWVGEHQQELIVRDVSKEKRFRYIAEFPNTQAEVALPLRVENRLLGVLDIQLDYAEDFDDSDMLVLRALAGQVSMAIEDTRLYIEARRRGDYLATISAVSSAIASTLDVDQLLEQVSELIRDYFDYPWVQLFTIQYGRRQIVYRAGSGVLAEAHKQQRPIYALDDLEGIIPSVARTGQTALVNDVNDTSAHHSALVTRSELAIPLIFNDKVLGVLDVQSDRTDAFGYHDQFTMETLAANIAVALRNANLYNTERWRYQVADSLRRISGALIADVNLTTVLDGILVELERNLPAEVLAIWLIRNKQLRLVTVQSPDLIGFPPDFDPEQDPWLTKGLTASEPLVRQNDDPSDPLAFYLGYPPNHSAIVTPLRVHDRVLGLLTLADSKRGRYGREAKAITSAFSNQAAIAIENARLFRLAQEEAQINSALLKVAEITQGFGDLDEVLRTIVEIPSLLTQVDQCAIWLREGISDTFEPKAASGFDPTALEFFRQYSLTSKVVALERLNQTHAPIIVVDAPGDARLPAEMIAGLTLDTLVLLPIVAHNDMLGFMLVTFANPSAIREEGIRLITGVAHQAAVAIESNYLYNQRAEQERLAHELKLAHDIQASLIPSHLPAPPGWEMAAFWQSARAVGGDFYDFIQVAPNQLGIVIADVSGKGMPAALYTTLTRSLMRAAAPGQTDPKAVLVRTNELLVPDTRGGMFVSLFYAILDTESGTLTYANAGHNPPLLIRVDGQSEALRTRGLVLGIRPKIKPEVGQRQLNSGDGVLFYTDGVTEVFDTSGNIFGETRLKTTAQDHWSQGPQALVAKIRQAVGDFSASALPSDDFTLLILRRV